MSKDEKIYPNCEHCGMRKGCFTADYVENVRTLMASLLWPTDKADWPFDPKEIKEILCRNIATHCKSFTADDSHRI